MGELLAASLQELDGVREVRGRGLMRSVVFEQPIARDFQSRCLTEGVIVNAVDDVTVRLVPPLVIGPAEIETAVERMRRAASPSPSEGAGRGAASPSPSEGEGRGGGE